MLESNYWFELPLILTKIRSKQGSINIENEAIQNLLNSHKDIKKKLECKQYDLDQILEKIQKNKGNLIKNSSIKRGDYTLEMVSNIKIKINSKDLESKLKEIKESLIRLIVVKSELICESLKLSLNLLKMAYEFIIDLPLKNSENLNKIQTFLKLTRITISKTDNEIYNINYNNNCQKLFIMIKVLCEKYQQKVFQLTEDSLSIFLSKENIEVINVDLSAEDIITHN